MEHFSWFYLLPPVRNNHKLDIFFTSLFILILTTGIAIIFSRRIKQTRKEKTIVNLIPDDKLTVKNIIELYLEFISSMVKGVIGKEGERYIPFIATLFLYILLCNLIGLIPGFLPHTNNLNTNFACAIVVFIYYHYEGFRTHGYKYLRQFTGPIWWLAILMFPIELISHLIRPLSLSVRLFGNITGDHYVFSIFTDLIPILIPVPFLALGIFVSFIQAFIFSILSMLYISIAISHEH